MHVEVVDAGFGNATHCDSVVEVLDSYAADPVGGGAPLTRLPAKPIVAATGET